MNSKKENVIGSLLAQNLLDWCQDVVVRVVSRVLLCSC